MIIPDKKKMATMIVAQMHHPQEDEAEGEGDSDTVTLAGELLKAIKTDDAKAVADAFYALWSAYEATEEDEEGESY